MSLLAALLFGISGYAQSKDLTRLVHGHAKPAKPAPPLKEYGLGYCYDDSICGDCFECDADGMRCIPIDGCSTTCYSDNDCQKQQYCNSDGICEDWQKTCYDDDECPGNKKCSYTSYECVDHEPDPTIPPPPGCCAGDSERSTERCMKAEDVDKCERSSSCHWIATMDPSECEWVATAEPIDPGCCTVGDTRPMAYEKGWDERCKTYFNEKECTKPTTADGYNRCLWTPTRDGYDCSLLWPTTEEPESGCCKADSAHAQSRCESEAKDKCDRMSSCHWVVTDDPSECDVTDAPEEPGCCVISDPSNPYSRWWDACPSFWSENECTRPNGACEWIATREDFDCSALWPTPPVENGCCAGDSEKTSERCAAHDINRCDRMSSCHWIVTDDVSECDFVPPETEPGCCYISEYQNPNSAWDGICKEYYDEDGCTRAVDSDGNPRCAFEVTEADVDCSDLWPTPTPTDAPEPGCCAGDAPHAEEPCLEFDDELTCTRYSMCHWLSGRDADCTYPTDEPEMDPGCCMASPDQNEDVWGDTCSDYWNEQDCLTPLGPQGYYRCEWIPTALNVDCALLWPTPSPTEVTEPPKYTPAPTMTAPTPDPTMPAPDTPVPTEPLYVADPSTSPTMAPSGEPTLEPTTTPTLNGYPVDTADPSTAPSTAPSSGPSEAPIAEPSVSPTAEPSSGPSEAATDEPSVSPTAEPSSGPSDSWPTVAPTSAPSSECGPEGCEVYFTSDEICDGYFTNGLEGEALQCNATQMEPWYIPGCGCGCVPPSEDPCEAVPDKAMGVGTPDSTCESIAIDCLPGYSPWSIPGCGCGCYATPLSPSPVEPPVVAQAEVETLAEDETEVEVEIETEDEVETEDEDEDEAEVEVAEACPPAGGNTLMDREELMDNVAICDRLEVGEFGGISCEDGWNPWFMSCGCGCAPISNMEANTEELVAGGFTVEYVSQVLNGEVSLSTVLLLAVAAFAMYQLYNWWESRRNEYIKLEDRIHANYQSI